MESDIDTMIAAIDKIRKPLDVVTAEEPIIRAG